MKKLWKIVGVLMVMLFTAKIAEGAMYYRKGKYETKYTVIHFDSIDDVYEFGENLASGFFEFNKSTKEQPSLIMQRVDGAVEDVAKKLNVPNISRFKVDVVLVRNQIEIASLRRSYDKEAITVMNTGAFYVARKHVIYLPLQGVDLELFKHELVHAIQYAYYGSTDEVTARKYQEG